ncbi:alpha/beta hydrolase [Coprothermobacter platensis]|uniref:alpha/beta hydrolase n=1 Tax=Coprothermobacter platensis TaxID=108819 RepID=UPI00036732ED|nr:alpha/beta hydrolase-fold protein [Coprothermobacter platensis]
MDERLIIRETRIPQLRRSRTVRIYLPPDYFSNQERRYPVLYMQDGQNLFEPSVLSGYSWQVDKTLDDLFNMGSDKYGFIVVGIDSNTEGTKRLDEYCPWQCRIYETPDDPWNYVLVDGEGDDYSAYIVDTLKPAIDEEFRTLSDREHTLVAGSSMGGLISLYMGLKYNGIFSKVGAFSTALLFAYDEMADFISRVEIENPLRVWMYVGGNEVTDPDRPDEARGFLNTNISISKLLQEKLGPENATLTVDPLATHSEEYWRVYFRKFIKWAAQA